MGRSEKQGLERPALALAVAALFFAVRYTSLAGWLERRLRPEVLATAVVALLGLYGLATLVPLVSLPQNAALLADAFYVRALQTLCVSGLALGTLYYVVPRATGNPPEAVSEQMAAKLRAQGVRLIATSSHKGTPLDQANLTGPSAVFIGSEGSGLPRAVLAHADELIAIPHTPQVESLNAGVAGSIVLYEAARQRRGQ